jgi:hypothetical protein
MNIYLELTRQFNAGALRAILSSGQAVVLHRLAFMSKDGDWILREDAAALEHVLHVLDDRGARYRFGAPLDVRWMRGGWSAHFEFASDGLRVRTDFVVRPPRLAETDLGALWDECRGKDVPFVDMRRLAELKKTNREKDYAVIGELARRMNDPRDEMLLSRSARDLSGLARSFPALATELSPRRPLLARAADGVEALEIALDAERRALIRQNEQRLRRYLDAAGDWRAAWPDVERAIAGLPLARAHEFVAERASALLPFMPS